MASIDVRFTEADQISSEDLVLIRDKVTDLMEFIRFQSGNPDMKFHCSVERIVPWS